MTHPIAPPESSADAILLVHALDNPTVTPELAADFGPQILQSTHQNALAWMERVVGRGFSVGETVGDAPSQAALPANADDTFAASPHDIAADERRTAYLQDTLDQSLTDHKPTSFTVNESRVILSALRRAVRSADRLPGSKRAAIEYLSRHSPLLIERAVCKLAFLATVVQVRGSQLLQ